MEFYFAQSQFLSALSHAISGRFVLIFVQPSTPNGCERTCVCGCEVERGKSNSDYEWTRNNPMSLISINLFSFAFITAHHRRHRKDTNSRIVYDFFVRSALECSGFMNINDLYSNEFNRNDDVFFAVAHVFCAFHSFLFARYHLPRKKPYCNFSCEC